MKKQNKSPEKLLEKQVLLWCRSKGWKVHVVEAKAVYSLAAGRYLNSQIAPGFSDIIGVMDNGIFVAIELKAFGRRSTLRNNQRAFLEDCINHFGFGVCVDRVELLQEYYDTWSKSPSKEYLISVLPKIKDQIEPQFKSSLF